MDFLLLIVKNIFTLPMLCFGVGIAAGLLKGSIKVPALAGMLIANTLLFLLGLKGGISFAGHSAYSSQFLWAAVLLTLWGALQPFVCFFLLKKFSSLTIETIAAISASFGSISLMTFMTASQYLESMDVGYEPYLLGILAIMEIPGIVTGLCLANSGGIKFIPRILKHAIFNRAILSLLGGGLAGYLLGKLELSALTPILKGPFSVLLCLFLFEMGLRLSHRKEELKSLNWRLILFGIYMPLIGASAGIMLSWVLKLDPGSGALVALASASASYIAAPATMRLALPKAQESIYLSLSLGIAFPFNVIFGIPLYYLLANTVLKMY